MIQNGASQGFETRHDRKNRRTARNFQGIENAFRLARTTCDTCTCLPTHPSPSCCRPSLVGESANAATDTAHCETLKHPSIYNSGEQKLRTSFAETRKTTKQMNQTALTGSEVAQKVAQVEDRAMSVPPSVRIKVPTELSGFLCAPPTRLLLGHSKLPHLSWRVSSTTKLLPCGCCPAS